MNNFRLIIKMDNIDIEKCAQILCGIMLECEKSQQYVTRNSRKRLRQRMIDIPIAPSSCAKRRYVIKK